MNKTSSKKITEAASDELVLTNMAFSSGLHFWEFHAPISCQNLRKPLITYSFPILIPFRDVELALGKPIRFEI